jgi:hypothetical protein
MSRRPSRPIAIPIDANLIDEGVLSMQLGMKKTIHTVIAYQRCAGGLARGLRSQLYALRSGDPRGPDKDQEDGYREKYRIGAEATDRRLE